MFEIITNLLLTYKYAIMVPLSLIMQPAVGVAGGILSRTGFMEPFVVYVVVCISALLGDVIWYLIGARWGEGFVVRFGKYFSITDERILVAKKVFHKYHGHILLISKIINGLGLAVVVLFTAGMVRIPFGRYMLFNIVGEMIWSAIIVVFGYFLGELYVNIKFSPGNVVLILVLVGLAFLFIRTMHNSYKRLAKSLEKEIE